VRVTLLGSTGRTGRLVAAELARRGHEVVALVRDPARAPAGVTPVVGAADDPTALARALEGAEAVVSALGPAGKDPDLHRRTAAVLVPAMTAAGVRRFVGVSGAGVDAEGDRKRLRDRAISRAMHLLAPAMVTDKEGELAAFAASDLDWTFVRPPRLTEGPATGAVESDPHVSTRSTTMSRADLATHLVDVLEQGLHVRRAPFAASR
jgi:putative NADH-flavin reductase